MDLEVFKSTVTAIKPQFEELNSALQDKLNELKMKEKEFVEMDEKADRILKEKGNKLVIINVSEKKFKTKLSTLLNIKDSIFYKLVCNGWFDKNEEIFIPESSYLFPAILDYMRYKTLEFKGYNKEELRALINVANYYNLYSLREGIDKYLWKPHIVGITYSDYYVSYNDKAKNIRVVKNLEDEENLTNGINFIYSYTGTITFELDSLSELNTLIVYPYQKVYTDYNAYYLPANWYLSEDGSSYTNCAIVTNIYSTSSCRFKLNGKKAKFLRCDITNNVGIGAIGIY